MSRDFQFINSEGRQVELHDNGYLLSGRYLPQVGTVPGDDGVWSPLWAYHVKDQATTALAYDVLARLFADPVVERSVMHAQEGITFHPDDPLTPVVLDHWANLAEGHTNQGGKTYSAQLVHSVRAKARELRERLAEREQIERRERAEAERKAAELRERDNELRTATREQVLDYFSGGADAVAEQRHATMQGDAERVKLHQLAHKTLDDALAKLPTDALRALLD